MPIDRLQNRYASFRFVGVNLVPSEVTTATKLTPTKQWDRGSQYTIKPREGWNVPIGPQTRCEGLWAIESDKLWASQDNIEIVTLMLTMLEPAREALRNFRDQQDTRSVFRVTMTDSDSLQLTPDQMRLIADISQYHIVRLRRSSATGCGTVSHATAS